MTSTPVKMRWNGEGMFPVSRVWQERADKRFVVGQEYPIDPDEERSQASHNFFFAAVNEGWANLPESMAADFPTSEHLRKRALIHTGHRDETSIVCASKAEALRVAAFVQPTDEYALVIVSGATVTRYVAKSQSRKAMGKAVFEQSKTDVLDWIGSRSGVTGESLKQNAGRAA